MTEQPPRAPWAPPPYPPARSGTSPGRLLLFFVLALAGVVVIVGAVALAVTPPRIPPVCPDPTVPCAQPPGQPSLEPVASNRGAIPIATAIRPASPLPPGGGAGALPIPTPRPASDAGRLAAGVTWRSDELGFSFEYDDQIWTVREEGSTGVFLTAARGNVGFVVTGFPANERSARDAFQREVERLKGQIVGLTEEPDAARQPPGLPIIGFEAGVGGTFAGAVDTPQGPSASLNVAILAATNGDLTLLVTVTTIEPLREAAYHFADGMLNTVQWPGQRP